MLFGKIQWAIKQLESSKNRWYLDLVRILAIKEKSKK
jgi:hypothetical protein